MKHSYPTKNDDNMNIFFPISSSNMLIYSSLIFITNAIAAYVKGYYVYSFLFCVLTITSVIFHSTNNKYVRVFDQLAVLSIILCGAYILYTKIYNYKWTHTQLLLIISTFVLCAYLYVYGSIARIYHCSNEFDISQKSHCGIHLIGSLGHHIIIFL